MRGGTSLSYKHHLGNLGIVVAQFVNGYILKWNDGSWGMIVMRIGTPGLLGRLRRIARKHPPRVFISSALTGLEKERSALYEMITQDLRWDAWCFERDGESQAVSPLTVCLKGIENSDIYVCLLGDHYGTSLDVEGISFTEREYEHACQCLYEGKISDIKLYISSKRNRNTNESVSDRLDQFIHAIGDPHVGHFSARFQNRDDLTDKVRDDLETWSRSSSRLIQLYLQEFLDNSNIIDLVEQDIRPMARNKVAKGPLKLSALTDELESLQYLGMKREYTNVIAQGLVMIDGMKYFTRNIRIPPITYRDKEVLAIWADILTQIVAAFNPYGYAHATLPLSKALFQIHKVLGNTVSYYSAAHSIANTLYILGKIGLAERWNAFSIYRLQQYPGSYDSEFDGRGCILKASNKIPAAESWFKKALQTTRSKAIYGSALSHLGEIKILQSSSRKERARGERYLEQAIEWGKAEPLAAVRTRRNWAKHLISVGAYEVARREVQHSIDIANRYELKDQLRRHLKPLIFSLDMDLT